MSNAKVAIKMLKVAWQQDRAYLLIVLFYALYNTGLSIFNAYSLKLVIEAATTQTLQETLMVGMLVVGVNLLFNFCNKLTTRLLDVRRIKLKNDLNNLLSKKLMELPYEFLEDPHYLDLSARARFAIDNMNSIENFLRQGAEIIQRIVTMIGLAVVILTFSPWIIVIMLVSAAITVLINLKGNKFTMNFFKELIPINRHFSYYLDTGVLSVEYAKDNRIGGMGMLLMSKIEHFLKKQEQYFMKYGQTMALYDGSSKVIAGLQQFALYLLIALKTYNLKLGAGVFTLYISSAISFSSALNQVFQNLIALRRYCEYLKPYLELIEIKNVDKSANIPLVGAIKTIEFKNVSFAYPRSDNLVLQDISFNIKQGEKISLVGLNGAGKTTLIKLLCRLYKPSSGNIFVNGVNINDYEYASYQQQISAVFQDFKLFAYSLAENITNDESKVKEAYLKAGQVGLKTKLDSLPQGIRSFYSKDYHVDGVELSGGESQKIAIARALYKDSSLVILDEPTSALDPLAEADIYQNFNNLIQQKTALYISHRMSSSIFCDKIIVLNNGKIEDFKSHSELMQNKDSLYYQLFTSQAKNYSLESPEIKV